MKLAIIGSGVSGLVSAYLLGRSHDVTVFESDSRIGGHIHTVPVKSPDGVLNIDTGFIVFNLPNYPGFVRLIEELGVESQSSRMSFSVKDERHGVEYSGSSIRNLFASKQNLTRSDHWRMLIDTNRFIRLISRLAKAEADVTVGQSVAKLGLSNVFLNRFLSPLGCALWSCPHESFLDFPVRFVAEFLENHQLINLRGRPEWRTIKGGSSSYVQALLAQTNAEVRVSRPVERVERTSTGIVVHSMAGSERFDEVIVAAHADQSISILCDATPIERELLGSIPYQKNEVVLHTDVSVLPENPDAWSSWNYRVPADLQSAATVTYNMNLLQTLSASETYCVSLNQTSVIDPDKVLGSFAYDHPVATVKGLAAKCRRNELIRHKGVSYCGAYWGNGFHEAGVQSALQVAKAFGEIL